MVGVGQLLLGAALSHAFQKMSEEKKIQQQNCCLPGNETVAYVSNDNVAGKPNFANLLSNEIVAILRSPLPWGLYLTNADREQSFGIIKPNWDGNGQFGRWSGGVLRELPLTPYVIYRCVTNVTICNGI